MPNKVDRIRRLRLTLEAIAQGIEQPAASQIASEALDTDNYLAENPQNVVDDQQEPAPGRTGGRCR
jgi:hypothetical protein